MKDEISKCLLCKNPFCKTCPAGTQVREAIELVKAGKHGEAGAMLFSNNPLSAITGAVCPNHLYCNGSCILNKKGNPVNFGKIEREISKNYLTALAAGDIKLERENSSGLNGKKVLIAGSGPAGLALAFYLTNKGHSVTIYEKESQFGGMMRLGIPDFRLDKSLIDKLVTVLENMGVEFRANTAVDLDNITQYKKDFDIVVLAIGACVSRRLGIEGEDLPLVTHAVEYLKKPESAKSVIVIGGGNVAIDCALTAAHLKSESVKLCYRRALEDMKAYPEELELAKNANVVFEFHMSPKKITPEGAVFARDGEEILVPADKVIIAIGQTATEQGFVKADGFKTEDENIYALGDAVTGTNTIIKAVAQAKELAGQL